MREYDQIYEWYVSTRDHQTGVNSVKNAFSAFDPGTSIVDLGCGTGQPLASTLKEMGLNVIGVDSSSKMAEKFHANFPQFEIHHSTIQDYEFAESPIYGALCWGCLFHLPPEAQILLLNNVFTALSTGGRFLFTSAKEKDQTTGRMNGIVFNYYSLGSDQYQQLASAAGCKLIHESEDQAKNYEYLFEKV